MSTITNKDESIYYAEIDERIEELEDKSNFSSKDQEELDMWLAVKNDVPKSVWDYATFISASNLYGDYAVEAIAEYLDVPTYAFFMEFLDKDAAGAYLEDNLNYVDIGGASYFYAD